MKGAERFIYLLALVGLLMSLAMATLSAYIRLADSGLGCEPWPTCQQVHIDQQPGITITSEDNNKAFRIAHRFLASFFGLVAMLLMVVHGWYRSHIRISLSLSISCLSITMLLAMVGMYTPDVEHPIIALTNLVGGMLLTALLWFMVMEFSYPSSGSKAPASIKKLFSLFNICLLIIVVSSGAWLSSNLAAGSCGGFLNCINPDKTNLASAYSLSRQLQLDNGMLLVRDVQATIEWSHQCLSIFLLLSLGLSLYLNGRQYRNSSLTILALMLSIMMLGLFENGQPSLLSAWLHNFWSLLLLLVLVFQYALIKHEGGSHA